MKSDFLIALTQLAAERNLPRDIVLSAIEAALVSAFRKDSIETGQEISVKLDPGTGDVSVYLLKKVVDEVENDLLEITLKDARKYQADITVGENVAYEKLPASAGRIAAQTAKQVVLQRLREAERELVYEEYADKEGDVYTVNVQRVDSKHVVCEMGRAEAILPLSEQIQTERYRVGQKIKVLLKSLERSIKGPELIISRADDDLLRRLFEMEVPEIYNGSVEIKAIAREPGARSKVAVHASQEGVDPVGSCVGLRGIRIQNIVNELHGEKIDIVEYSEDPEEFTRRALSPAKISRIIVDHKEEHMMIVVPDDQMSLAIGKKGQNVKLAAKLVKWKIDIKGESETRALLEQQSPLLLNKNRDKEFFDSINNCKELDESVAPALAENKIRSFDNILEQGVEGLCELPGFEIELASKLVSLAETYKKEATELTKPVLEEKPETKEIQEDSIHDEEIEESAEEPIKPEVLEEEEYPLDALEGVDQNILTILSENGFQTLAELSITPLEELAVLEGIDENMARMILNQAKQRTEKVENT